MHDSLMRGGFCALWMFAFILAFYGFLDASFADNGSPEQTAAGLRFIVLLCVGIAAASAHGYLVHIAKKKEDGKRN